MTGSAPQALSTRDQLYDQAASQYAAPLDRLARAYEADSEKQADLLQEIHLAVWQSLAGFEGRCSLRTWIYRVAHNTAATYVVNEQRKRARQWVSLDDIEAPVSVAFDDRAEQRLDVERLMELVRNLRPPDRQLMLLYLEDLDAQSIGDITGMSAGHVRVQLHRIRKILAERFHGGSRHE